MEDLRLFFAPVSRTKVSSQSDTSSQAQKHTVQNSTLPKNPTPPKVSIPVAKKRAASPTVPDVPEPSTNVRPASAPRSTLASRGPALSAVAAPSSAAAPSAVAAPKAAEVSFWDLPVEELVQKIQPAKDVVGGAGTAGTAGTVDGQLLTEVLRPTDPAGIIGYEKEKSTVLTWIQNIKARRNTLAIALLSGPPGVGKTTLATAALTSTGYQILELNASQSRTLSDAENIWETISHAHPFMKPYAVIIDEADGMTAEGIKCIVEVGVRSMKLMRRVPIICTCNDMYAKCLKSMVPKCLSVRFWSPKPYDIRALANTISRRLKLSLPARVFNEITMLTDFRQVVNFFDYYCRNKTQADLSSSSIADVQSTLQKDKNYSLFDAARKLLELKGNLEYSHRETLHYADHMIPGMLHQNYARMLSDLDSVADIADSFSDFDVVSTYTNSRQDYSVWPTGALCGTIIPSYRLNKKIDISKNFRERFHFPDFLGKGSAEKRNTEVRTEACIRFGVQKDLSALPYVKLIMEDKEKHEALDYKDLHNLRPQDLDVLAECASASYIDRTFKTKTPFKKLKQVMEECTESKAKKRKK